MKTITYSLTPYLLIAMLLLTLPGCSLFYSRERQLRTRLNDFGAMLSNKEWKRAAKLVAADFRYINEDNRNFGKNSLQQFLGELEAAKANDIFLHVDELREIDKESILVVLMLQMRRGDATGAENRFQDLTMLWEYRGGKWLLVELKQKSPTRTSRS